MERGERQLADITPDLAKVRQVVGEKLQELSEDTRAKIETGETKGFCWVISQRLREMLEGQLPVKIARSKREDNNSHAYLVIQADNPGQDIIIDPTANQFISGYQGVFMGTRDELRQLVLGSKIINTKSRNNPEEAFERAWGKESSIYW